MPVELRLPGLDHLLSPLPAGSSILVEGSVEAGKKFLVHHLARQAAEQAGPVTFLTSRSAADVLGHGEAPAPWRTIEGTTWKDVAGVETGNVVVDSFAMLCADTPVPDLASHFRRRRAAMEQQGALQVLAAEPAMLDAQRQAVLHHFADGIIQFHARDDSEGLTQFLRVPKWPGGEALNGNMYYGFDGKRLSIDTRKRVN